MKVKDLTREIEEFQAALIAHQDLYVRSVDVELDDYPWENEGALHAQSRQLARMLGRLRPFITRFRPNWLVRHPATGLTVDVLEVAVGMAHTVHIKGEAFQHAIDGVEQVIGSLQGLDPDDEIPDDPKSPVRPGALADKLMLGSRPSRAGWRLVVPRPNRPDLPVGRRRVRPCPRRGCSSRAGSASCMGSTKS